MKEQLIETPVRACIYARISKDRDGQGLGVDRQKADCRALAERLGYEVVTVYVENDVSASTRSKKARPQYEAMVRAVRAGEVDAILAYSNSRLTRRLRELLDLIDLHAATGVRIVTVKSGQDDLSTADGRMVAQIKGSVDQAEAERTAERLRDQKRQAAEAGKFGGGHRPYGFEPDGLTVREDEAAVIRELTEGILNGRSTRVLAQELNDRGLTNSMGNPWTYSRVREVVMRPRNAGLISKGQSRLGKAEIIGPGSWSAIVTEDEWRAVYDHLRDSSRRTSEDNASRWLGSSYYECGRPGCESVMRSAVYGKKSHGSRRHHYRCAESGHVTIAAIAADEEVRSVMVRALADERLIKALTAREGDDAQADRDLRKSLVRRLAQTERDYDEDLIDARRYQTKTAKLQKEITEVDVRLAHAAQHATTSPVLSALDPGAAFLNAPVDVQRALLRQVFRVRIDPAEAQGRSSNEQARARVKVAPVVSLAPA